MLKGIDVSNNNGRVNISGKDFVIAKCTEGTGFKDDTFLFYWSEAKSRDMLRGAYHFMDPGADPTFQAEFFADTVKSLGLMTSDILVVDVEETALTNADITTFIRKLEALTGKNVFIYTMYSLIRLGRFSGLYTQPLWIANPGGPIGNPPSPKPWPVWTIQQYSWDVVDEDVFNGGKEAWLQLANLENKVLDSPKALQSSEKPIVSFDWDGVTGAAQYQLQVADKAGKIVHDAMTSATGQNVVLNPGTHYTWRVKSSPDGTWSESVEHVTR